MDNVFSTTSLVFETSLDHKPRVGLVILDLIIYIDAARLLVCHSLLKFALLEVFQRNLSLTFKIFVNWGAWMVQLIKQLPAAQVMTLES